MRPISLCVICSLATIVDAGAQEQARAARPNVVLIITDDQGYGDLGVHGNPKIRTPNLDRLAGESVRLDRFYVSPVCSPTRSSLMTGRYNYRTGVVDTFLGRSMMRPDEVTLAEMLGAAGYRTGIFGKWHLGDHYPLRPIDQGFQEALVLRGGGIGQPSDPPESGGDSYFDPILQRNGRQVKTKGYCSDVYTDAAMDFIAADRSRPFFVYLPFNCPHAPLQVPDSYLKPYLAMDLSNDQFPKVGHPLPEPTPKDITARVYGMVTNIDDNVGRLLARLDELKLADDTIVVYLTDNGPQQVRYVAGMRGRKGGTYEGGIRVPGYVRWPGKLQAGRVVDRIAAHIDLTPTLLEACGVAKPDGVAFDGKSILPLMKGEAVEWPDRTLFFQWHRGDEPERYRAFAARSQGFKIVRSEAAKDRPLETSIELFDMESDPLEMRDIAREHPEILARLRKEYEAWFDDVGRRGYDPPRIVLGAPQEIASTLTRQDWRGPRAGWGPDGLGHWEVEVARAGTYAIALKFQPRPEPTTAHVSLGDVHLRKEVPPNAASCAFDPVSLPPGPGRLEASIARDGDRPAMGVLYVDVERAE
jgi:arylsulfatase A-like enzyme